MFIICYCFYNRLVPAPNVSVAPDDTITLVPGTASTASFTCTVVSFTDVINVTWTTTADQIVTQPSFVSESEFGVYTSVLTIDGVLPDNGGVYMCTAVNEAGMNSDTGVLNVTSKIEFRKEREGEGKREERKGEGGNKKGGGEGEKRERRERKRVKRERERIRGEREGIHIREREKEGDRG